MIGPVQSRCHESRPVGKRNLRWEGFVEKVGFESGVKEWRSEMMRVVMIIEMSWQVNEKVSRDVTGEADGKNPGVDSTDGVMHIWMSDLWKVNSASLSCDATVEVRLHTLYVASYIIRSLCFISEILTVKMSVAHDLWRAFKVTGNVVLCQTAWT